MRGTYVFALRSEIKVEEGNWTCLLLERDAKRISIEKPLPRTRFDWRWDSLTMHSGTPPPKAWFEFEAGRDEFDTSLITMQVEVPHDVGEGALHDVTRETALAVLQELTSWIRVLTGQFWVGYHGRSGRPHKYVMYIGEGKTEEPRYTGGAGWGFEYGRDLDAKTWAEIGTRLGLARRPRPSRLFFCDALLDIVEGDIPQAVVALGVSCELEVSALVQDIATERGKEVQWLVEKYISKKLRFGEAVRLLKDFGCDSFSDFDNQANCIVQNLYEARGKAVHSGEPYFVDGGKKVVITRSEISKYVRAVEKLFAWSDTQTPTA